MARSQNKTILNWLIIITKFNLRPKYYIYNKNHAQSRNLHLPKPKTNLLRAKAKKPSPQLTSQPNITNTLQFEHLLNKHNLKPIFKPNPKGGLHVTFQ